jgi:hypothetical protein
MKRFLGVEFDRLGVTASALCIIHCLGTSVLGYLLPAWALSLFTNERIHAGLAAGVVLVGLLAFVPGVRLHRNWPVAIFALLGLSAITISQILPEHFGIETPLTIFGGSMLVVAHWQNLVLCRQCRCMKCKDAAFDQSNNSKTSK